MTADEIRADFKYQDGDAEMQTALFVSEIAAQLAEMNEKFHHIAQALKHMERLGEKQLQIMEEVARLSEIEKEEEQKRLRSK